jgi:hypothetical protein
MANWIKHSVPVITTILRHAPITSPKWKEIQKMTCSDKSTGLIRIKIIADVNVGSTA